MENIKPEVAGAGLFVSPCPPPTGYDAEILVVIDEELHEICEAISGVLADGLAPTPESCRHLAMEVGDLYETVRRATEAGTLPEVVGGQGSSSPPSSGHALLVSLLHAASYAGQRVCKALRFGLRETQQGWADDNATRVARSIGAVRDAVVAARALIASGEIENGMARKSGQLNRFLQTSPTP
jgi:hypothetical protein